MSSREELSHAEKIAALIALADQVEPVHSPFVHRTSSVLPVVTDVTWHPIGSATQRDALSR